MKLCRIATLGEPRFPSPLGRCADGSCRPFRFIDDEQWVRNRVVVRRDDPEPDDYLFEKAGPRARLFFDPPAVRAAIVTCGGLCPGLNNVIRSLVLELCENHGVREVLGIRNGLQGMNPQVGPEPFILTPDTVASIHNDGGTILGSSRGPQAITTIVEFLIARDVSQLFMIGGDGTQRATHAIAAELDRRGAAIAVVGIPKTIDNDVPFCDRTFGFVSAVEQAAQAVQVAEVEARGMPRCVGLVKLMGRHAGFIACLAALAAKDVDFVLIPEQPLVLDGALGFLVSLENRVESQGRAVIVVAEGAGQDLFAAGEAGLDASGNRRLHDIGGFLKRRISEHFATAGRPVEVKYIETSYAIRGVPANCDDRLMCDQFARLAVHAAMAGKTDLTICQHNSKFMHVPTEMVGAHSKRIDLQADLWSAVLDLTGQPATFGV